MSDKGSVMWKISKISLMCERKYVSSIMKKIEQEKKKISDNFSEVQQVY